MLAVMTYGVRTSMTGDTLELVHSSSNLFEASQEAFYEFGSANMRPLQRISFRLTDGRKVLAYSRVRGFSGSLYFQLSQ